MMAKYLHIFVVFAFFWGGAQPDQSKTAFEKLTQRFENGQVFHADFRHHHEDSFTGNTSTEKGEIWIGKNEYKIQSATQRVAVDGKLSRVYDSQRNRLIKSTYVPEEDDFAPSRFLSGVDSTYTIVEQQKKREDQYFIKLKSEDPFAIFQTVEITLGEEGIPQKVFVRDTADNLITTTFSSGKFIEQQPDMFELTYPASAEIIDMRN